MPHAEWIGDWDKPARIEQLEIWGEPRDRVLAYAGISIDDMERWRAAGWISFDVREIASFDGGQSNEMCFIRNIARSGFGDVQIQRLLNQLERPYLYDPLRMAYSFALGWVQCPVLPTREERDDFIKNNFSSWIHELVLLGEDKLVGRMFGQLLDASAAARANRIKYGDGDEGDEDSIEDP